MIDIPNHKRAFFGINTNIPHNLLDHYVLKYGTTRIYGHPNEFYDLINSKLGDMSISNRRIDESYNNIFDECIR